MKEAPPLVGQVISYAYLWKREAREGRKEGLKERPCAIVRVLPLEAGEQRVYIAPITHTSPQETDRAIEIPVPVKRRLGLDDERSWLVTTEINHFVWPGYDLRRTPDGQDRYGTLPGNMIRVMIEHIASNVRDRTLRAVDRDG